MKEGLYMFNVPYAKMICDSDKGDGGINFYDEYCEWVNRSNGNSFKVYYQDIDDVKIISGLKKTVIVTSKSGEKVRFYLYKAATLQDLLYKAIQRVNGVVVEEEKEKEVSENKDCIDQLERLAKLHDSGAITDEEYSLAKQKILKM